MEELNALELTLLNGLTKKYSSLKLHIPYLKIANREINDIGMVVNLVYVNAEGMLVPEDLNALFSNQERIQIKSLQNGLGYVIDVTDGEIKFIEFMTYGESWDGIFQDYKIVPVK